MTTIRELLDRYESQKNILSMATKDNLLYEMAKKLEEMLESIQLKLDLYNKNIEDRH